MNTRLLRLKKSILITVLSLFFNITLIQVVPGWYAEYSQYKYLSWSPEGQYLAYEDYHFDEGAYAGTNNIAVVDIKTGQKRYIMDCIYAYYSVNGNFPSNGNCLSTLIVTPDIGRLFARGDSRDDIVDSAVAPDGEQLICSWYHYGYAKVQLYKIYPDGSGKELLVGDIGEVKHNKLMIWHPDMDRILFTSGIDTDGDGKVNHESKACLWTINIDGTNKRQLTQVEVDDAFYVKGGEKIVYLSKSTLWQMGSDGDNKMMLAETHKGKISNVSLSPDSSKIAYSCNANIPYEIWVMDNDGHSSAKLTDKSISKPYWSPDSKKIAFTSRTDTNGDGVVKWEYTKEWKDYDEKNIWVVDIDGDNLRQVTDIQKGSTVQGYTPRSLQMTKIPVWSLNKSLIMFIDIVDVNDDKLLNAKDHRELFIANISDSSLERLTYKGVEEPPRWLNKEQIIYKNRNNTLMLLNIKTKSKKTVSLENSGQPSWAPDGNKIVFASVIEDTSNIWIIDLRTCELEQITTEGGSHPVWSEDGSQIAFIQEDDTLSINIDGTGRRELTANDKDHFPKLGADRSRMESPSGNKIAFIKTKYYHDKSYPHSEIWIMNTDSTGEEILVEKRTNF